jgi:nucleoside-triphosphatase
VENALGCDLIVVDEVGPMELLSQRFVDGSVDDHRLAEANAGGLEGKKPMLVVLKEKSQHTLAKKIRESFRVITVTTANRDALPERIVKELSS